MAKKNIFGKKNITGATTQNSFSTNSSSSTSTGASWNTSRVSGRTIQDLRDAERKYRSQYAKPLSSALGTIENRKKFEYDVNKDALYQNAKKQYQLMGQQAMDETMANSTALSGGYGNSYATTAGMQAYQAQLDKLSGMMPEYYQQARENYDNETNNLYNKANLFAGLESEAYQRWAAERDYAYGKYNDEWQRNAVSHSKQTDTSTQTQSSSNTQTTYNANAGKKQVNKLQITPDDYKTERTARNWLYNNGLENYATDFDTEDKTGIATFNEWKNHISKGNKNRQGYKRYIQDYLLQAGAGK